MTVNLTHADPADEMFRFAVLTEKGHLLIETRPVTTETDTLRHLQEAVGGYIERMDLRRNGLDAFGNEEGLYQGMTLNITASRVLRYLSGLPWEPVGPVAFASHAGADTRSLTDAHLRLVIMAYNKWVPADMQVHVPATEGGSRQDGEG